LAGVGGKKKQIPPPWGGGGGGPPPTGGGGVGGGGLGQPATRAARAVSAARDTDREAMRTAALQKGARHCK